ncbi:PREDICTED: protein TIFY 11B [Tarenaya hassleriana]|uniref:protein TIFY 11B n=1 Tax=Tarenaya hassleriana TaxID=28532 RepID=UPI00053C4DC2|nr:PREDICTED: protein TIFY 11B [Tarenaya hassleriana]
MPNNATEKAPEKSKFSRRCNLLSRYLKQNGSFGGIDLGLTRKPDSGLGIAGKPNPAGQQKSSEFKPIDFMQKGRRPLRSASYGSEAKDADFSEPASVPEPGTSQLTIFFSGKVIVFNDFPADKAKEIMEIVKPETFSTVVLNSDSMADEICSRNHLKANGDKNNSSIVDIITITSSDNSSENSLVIPDLNEPTCLENDSDHQTRQQNQLMDRIARRASLHRFFAKRKDRAAARAPYQVNQNTGHPPKPEVASSSSVGLGQSWDKRITSSQLLFLNQRGICGERGGS